MALEPDMAALIQESRREVLGSAAPSVDPSPAPQNLAPEPAPEVDPAPATPSTSATAEDRFTDLDPETLDPALRDRYRQMQTDYTRKTQSLAEVRKKFEGVPDQTIEFARMVEQLATTDPRAAARVLQQQAEAFEQAFGDPSPEAPYDPWSQGTEDAGQLQPQSETEAYLLTELQQMKRAQQVQAQREQANRIRDEMAEVAKIAGTPLPVPDQVRVIRYAAERNVTLPEAYRLLNWQTLVDRERHQAREEATSAALQRAGLPPTGGGLTHREAPPPEITDVKEIARAELRRLKGT